MFIDLAHAMK